MNIAETAQIVGIVSFSLILLIKLYILMSPKAWAKSGRAVALWILVYFFFLYALRLLAFFKIGAMDDLRIVSGFATVIPLAGIIAHVFLLRSMPVTSDTQQTMDEVRALLQEAKDIRHKAQLALDRAKTVPKAR